jgi:WD40 repeat protein
VRVLSTHKKPISSVAFSPDGALLAEAATDGIRVWELAAGSVAHTFDSPWLCAPATGVAFSPDGGTLAATPREVWLFTLGTGSPCRLGAPVEGRCSDVAFARGGREVLTTCDGNRSARWDVKSARRLPNLKLPVVKDTLVTWPALAVSPDGARVALARRLTPTYRNLNALNGIDRDALLVYDLTKNTVVAQFGWTGRLTAGAAYAPDGELVAAASGATVRVWSVGSRELVAQFLASKKHLMKLAFSADGKYIAPVSKDRTTRFWEVGAWDQPKTFEWNVGQLLTVAFSPDGTTAAVASDKGQIVLFDVD